MARLTRKKLEQFPLAPPPLAKLPHTLKVVKPFNAGGVHFPGGAIVPVSDPVAAEVYSLYAGYLELVERT
jgi:hypothetical protein